MVVNILPTLSPTIGDLKVKTSKLFSGSKHNTFNQIGRMPQKIKYNGQTLQVEILGPNDKITEKCLTAWGNHNDNISDPDIVWTASSAQGETPAVHPDRTYVKVLSKFF